MDTVRASSHRATRKTVAARCAMLYTRIESTLGDHLWIADGSETGVRECPDWILEQEFRNVSEQERRPRRMTLRVESTSKVKSVMSLVLMLPNPQISCLT